jgi:uncharacterized protein
LLAGRTRTRPLRGTAAAIAVLAIAAPGASAADTTSPPSISVVGHASRKAVNDTARVRFGVVSRAPTAVAALNRNSARAQRVVNAVKAQGNAPADIKTENVSLRLVRVKHKHRPTEVFYRASNSIKVTVRAISRVAPTIDAAVRAGATSVSGVDFSTSKQDALYRQALSAAFDDAKAKAQLLADRAGVTLGTPLQIVEGVELEPGVGVPSAGGGSSGVPIQPGTSTVRAEVTVVFAIL